MNLMFRTICAFILSLSLSVLPFQASAMMSVDQADTSSAESSHCQSTTEDKTAVADCCDNCADNCGIDCGQHTSSLSPTHIDNPGFDATSDYLSSRTIHFINPAWSPPLPPPLS